MTVPRWLFWLWIVAVVGLVWTVIGLDVALNREEHSGDGLTSYACAQTGSTYYENLCQILRSEGG